MVGRVELRRKLGVDPSIETILALSNSRLMLDKHTRARNRVLLDAHMREQERQGLILRNICPTCGGKLSSGVKDKRNNYKRSWYCLLCNEKHYI